MDRSEFAFKVGGRISGYFRKALNRKRIGKMCFDVGEDFLDVAINRSLPGSLLRGGGIHILQAEEKTAQK